MMVKRASRSKREPARAPRWPETDAEWEEWEDLLSAAERTRLYKYVDPATGTVIPGKEREHMEILRELLRRNPWRPRGGPEQKGGLDVPPAFRDAYARGERDHPLEFAALPADAPPAKRKRVPSTPEEWRDWQDSLSPRDAAEFESITEEIERRGGSVDAQLEGRINDLLNRTLPEWWKREQERGRQGPDHLYREEQRERRFGPSLIPRPRPVPDEDDESEMLRDQEGGTLPYRTASNPLENEQEGQLVGPNAVEIEELDKVAPNWRRGEISPEEWQRLKEVLGHDEDDDLRDELEELRGNQKGAASEEVLGSSTADLELATGYGAEVEKEEEVAKEQEVDDPGYADEPLLPEEQDIESSLRERYRERELAAALGFLDQLAPPAPRAAVGQAAAEPADGLSGDGGIALAPPRRPGDISLPPEALARLGEAGQRALKFFDALARSAGEAVHINTDPAKGGPLSTLPHALAPEVADQAASAMNAAVVEDALTVLPGGLGATRIAGPLARFKDRAIAQKLIDRGITGDGYMLAARLLAESSGDHAKAAELFRKSIAGVEPAIARQVDELLALKIPLPMPRASDMAEVLAHRLLEETGGDYYRALKMANRKLMGGSPELMEAVSGMLRAWGKAAREYGAGPAAKGESIRPAPSMAEIEAQRKAAGITREELARAANIAESTIYGALRYGNERPRTRMYLYEALQGLLRGRAQ